MGGQGHRGRRRRDGKKEKIRKKNIQKKEIKKRKKGEESRPIRRRDFLLDPVVVDEPGS